MTTALQTGELDYWISTAKRAMNLCRFGTESMEMPTEKSAPHRDFLRSLASRRCEESIDEMTNAAIAMTPFEGAIAE